MNNEKEKNWKDKNAVVIYSEKDKILSARGTILDISDNFITIKTDTNKIASSRSCIIKIKFPEREESKESEKDGVFQ